MLHLIHKAMLHRSIISNLTAILFSCTVYANPTWTERLVYTVDNKTIVIGESEWSETKYDAFQSAFLDGLNKINVMKNASIETTYTEKVFNGKVNAEEFSKIRASNDMGEIVVVDSFAEREHVSDLHRVFVMLEVLPEKSLFSDLQKKVLEMLKKSLTFLSDLI